MIVPKIPGRDLEVSLCWLEFDLPTLVALLFLICQSCALLLSYMCLLMQLPNSKKLACRSNFLNAMRQSKWIEYF